MANIEAAIEVILLGVFFVIQPIPLTVRKPFLEEWFIVDVNDQSDPSWCNVIPFRIIEGVKRIAGNTK